MPSLAHVNLALLGLVFSIVINTLQLLLSLCHAGIHRSTGTARNERPETRTLHLLQPEGVCISSLVGHRVCSRTGVLPAGAMPAGGRGGACRPC